MPRRLWGGLTVGLLGVALSIVTLIRPDWIEFLFEVDPDAGTGKVEWLLALAFLVAGVFGFAFAGLERRRQFRHTSR